MYKKIILIKLKNISKKRKEIIYFLHFLIFYKVIYENKA